MDDPNITMGEYIRLEEEKARRHAIAFNDAFTSKVTLSCEPTVSPFNDNKIDFRIWFNESKDEDYTVIYDKNSFSYKIISVSNLKMDSENDNEKVNMPSFPSPEPNVSYFDDLDFLKDFENEFPAIVYNDALTSKSDSSIEPVEISHRINEFNLKNETSLSECDEEEQNVLYFNDLFPFNVIYPDDSKSNKDNDDEKIDVKQSSGVIMEYLVNISKRRAFWRLNKDILKITILKTNTPYPSRKIRRTDEDDDDLEGIIDYLEPTLYDGFIDSDDEEYKEKKISYMGDDVDISTLTIEQYLVLIQDNNRPGIVKPEIGNDVEFEINSNFMRELRRKIFAGTDDEDAHEHVRRMLDSEGFITLMTPTQAFISIQVMADHSHNLYDETTTKEKINDNPNNIDAIQESFKEAHPTKERLLKKEGRAVEQSKYMRSLEETIIKFCKELIKKQTADDEWIRKSIKNTDSNIRAPRTTTKNVQEKAYQLTQTVLTDTGEKVKARMTMGKESVKEPVPRDLPVVQTYAPPTPFLGHLKGQIGSPYRTRETVCMIENPGEKS
ncbi:hypothetical protein Tco_0746619 [Tanacetum coccineum]